MCVCVCVCVCVCISFSFLTDRISFSKQTFAKFKDSDFL